MIEGHAIVATEKIHGVSMTVRLSPETYQLDVFNRNMRVFPTKSTNAFFEAVRNENLEWKLKQLETFTNVPSSRYIFQGECFGPGIQNNPLNVPHVVFAVFNVWDTITEKYMSHDEYRHMCGLVGIRVVKEVLRTNAMHLDVDTFLEMSKGFYEGTRYPREGIVVRLVDNSSVQELIIKHANKTNTKPPVCALTGLWSIFSFKVINPEFNSKL